VVGLEYRSLPWLGNLVVVSNSEKIIFVEKMGRAYKRRGLLFIKKREKKRKMKRSPCRMENERISCKEREGVDQKKSQKTCRGYTSSPITKG